MDDEHARPIPQDERAERILSIVAKETGLDRSVLLPDATIEELGIASLDLTQAVFEIETVFDVEIPVVAERTGAEFSTIGDLVGHVLAVLDKVDADRAGKAASAAQPA
jgi:acyl carrier protein